MREVDEQWERADGRLQARVAAARGLVPDAGGASSGFCGRCRRSLTRRAPSFTLRLLGRVGRALGRAYRAGEETAC